MADSGGARANAASARPDPSALTTTQLLDISTAAACNHARDASDFAHLAKYSLPQLRAYVYATGTSIQQGLLEEERRAIKIPKTFKEAITSPKAKQAMGGSCRQGRRRAWSNTRSISWSLSPAFPRERRSSAQGSHSCKQGRRELQGQARTSRPRPGIGHRLRKELRKDVCRLGSVRTLVAIACEHGWPVWQMDVAVAFLQSAIDKAVWVKPVPGQDVKDPATGEIMVYKLERSLYGLAQSPVLWYDTIDEVFMVDWIQAHAVRRPIVRGIAMMNPIDPPHGVLVVKEKSGRGIHTYGVYQRSTKKNNPTPYYPFSRPRREAHYRAWLWSYDHGPSHPYKAGTEHVRISPTRQVLFPPCAKRREVVGESHER